MAFSSPLFLLLFIPVFFLAYFACAKKYGNAVLLAGSLIFYIWGAPMFAVILALSIVIDWFLVNAMFRRNPRIDVGEAFAVNKIVSEKSASGNTAREILAKAASKKYLLAFIVSNLAMLAYFKYANFFIESLNPLLVKLGSTSGVKWHQVIIPLGVSFIIFHKLSYALDVYFEKARPVKFADYALYILMFPKILAGPITKYRDISKQLAYREVSLENTVYGIYLFSRGLAKKVLIADTLGVVVDGIFNLPVNSLDTAHAWIGIVGYTFQLYFDFSGYSDMAIGLARIMGFKLSVNFNHPYISQSFTEFWRRWHITLSAWFKDYLYIPLGGNRCSKSRNYFNLWFVFLVSGIWHGANWTFIVWGIYHGTFLVMDKLFWLNLSKKVPRVLNIAVTFCLIMLGWVFFRSESLAGAIQYIQVLFGVSQAVMVASPVPPLANSEITALAVAAALSFLPFVAPLKDKLGEYREWSVYRNREVLYMAGTVALLFFTVSKVVGSSVTTFIYFKF